MDKLKEKVEEQIKNISQEGINDDNINVLYKLVDIHKDIENEEYWTKKKEVMEMNYGRSYGNYEEGRYNEGRYNEGSYNEGMYGRRRRDSRGRYARGNSGRRYQGEDMIEDMHESYQRYSEGREEMNMGNYGAKSDTMKSLDYMLQSVVEFIEMLKKDASSQEEVQLIQKYTQHISEM